MEHVLDEVENSLDQGSQFIEAHSTRIVLIKQYEGSVDLVTHGASTHNRHAVCELLSINSFTAISIEKVEYLAQSNFVDLHRDGRFGMALNFRGHNCLELIKVKALLRSQFLTEISGDLKSIDST